ncbi:MAG: hypothetical protein ACYCSO_09940 [Cuniculiplasma sp.]
MSKVLKNIPVIIFTECRIASNSGATKIKTRKNIPFPEYSNKGNYSFQGGGKLQYVYEVHKTKSKL